MSCCSGPLVSWLDSVKGVDVSAIFRLYLDYFNFSPQQSFSNSHIPVPSDMKLCAAFYSTQNNMKWSEIWFQTIGARFQKWQNSPFGTPFLSRSSLRHWAREGTTLVMALYRMRHFLLIFIRSLRVRAISY